jgi:hypothetical protein
MRFVLVCAALSLTGCVEHFAEHAEHRGDPVRETRAVELGKAESARVQLDIGAGELRVNPGAANLVDADFTYDTPALKPEISQQVSAGRAYVTLRQPPLERAGLRSVHHCTWDLKLNGKVPTDLKIRMGAGKSVLKLAGLQLTRLNMQIGAGEVEVDLNGRWNQDLDVEINGGVGEATVRLPKDVGVRVKASGGLGEINVDGLRRSGEYWVNDAYGRSGVDLRLEISGGIGSIRIIG